MHPGGIVTYEVLLPAAERVAVVHGNLRLLDGEGALLASFEPAEPTR